MASKRPPWAVRQATARAGGLSSHACFHCARSGCPIHLLPRREEHRRLPGREGSCASGAAGLDSCSGTEQLCAFYCTRSSVRTAAMDLVRACGTKKPCMFHRARLQCSATRPVFGSPRVKLSRSNLPLLLYTRKQRAARTLAPRTAERDAPARKTEMHANGLWPAIAAIRGTKREAVTKTPTDRLSHRSRHCSCTQSIRQVLLHRQTTKGPYGPRQKRGAQFHRQFLSVSQLRPLQSRPTDTLMQPLWVWLLWDRTLCRYRRTGISRTPSTSTPWSPLAWRLLCCSACARR